MPTELPSPADALDRKRRAFALMRDALDLADAERDAFVQGQAGNDAELIAEVTRLLHAHGATLLDREAGEVAARLDRDIDSLSSGTVLGDWRIVHALGSGGMGTVYLAEREGDGYVQRGALKLIKRGMDSAEVLARFRRERQILSRLDHPHIARLLDGGIAPDGRPWLVMEHVDGTPLDVWTAESHPLAERVDLVIALTDAVAHAHQRLVVHRDIKPGNVLIDAQGRPRLLDFGIAKVLEDTAADTRTATAQRFVSRAWAAPEQLDGRAVTTASDVYQLGALLHELLTGARLAADEASGRPSQLLVQAHARSGANAPPGIDARDLSGDLGIIVARATDAEPARRYATAEAFADDLRRWKGGRPILARPDSGGYRLARFVARHRFATAFATLAVLAIVVGAVVSLVQARRATEEARLARSAQAFLTGVFDAAAPDAAAGQRVTARELLDRGAERVRGELADQPRLQGEMLLTLGTLYRQLGQYEQAAALLTDADHVLSRESPGSARAIEARLERAVVERERGKLGESEAALAVIEPALRDDAARARLHVERAFLREKQGRFDDALADARVALTSAERLHADATTLARARQAEALMLTRLGRFDEGSRSFQAAIAAASAAYGEDDTRVAQMRNDYAIPLAEKARFVEAEREIRLALEARRKRLGAAHPAVAESLQVLGATLRPQGKLDNAEKALGEALNIQRAAFGNQNSEVANTLNSLGMLASARRDSATAAARFKESLDIYTAIGLADTTPAATVANNYATYSMRAGHLDEAEPLMRRALATHLAAVGENHPMVMSDLNSLTQLALRQRRPAEALEFARRAMAITDALGISGVNRAGVLLSLATALERTHSATEALARADETIALFEAAKIPPADPRMAAARLIRGDALRQNDRNDEAETLAREVLAAASADTANDTSIRISAHALLARIADSRARPAEATRARAKARELLATLPNPDPDLAVQIDGW